jgi:hypothetical protein
LRSKDFLFTPGFSPVIAGPERLGNRFNGFLLHKSPKRLNAREYVISRKGKPLKRLRYVRAAVTPG